MLGIHVASPYQTPADVTPQRPSGTPHKPSSLSSLDPCCQTSIGKPLRLPSRHSRQCDPALHQNSIAADFPRQPFILTTHIPWVKPSEIFREASTRCTTTTKARLTCFGLRERRTRNVCVPEVPVKTFGGSDQEDRDRPRSPGDRIQFPAPCPRSRDRRPEGFAAVSRVSDRNRTGDLQSHNLAL